MPTNGSGQAWRIIPASAGNTQGELLEVGELADHPRERGEHDISGNAVRAFRGSSPRARGTPVQIAVIGNQIRIIPASAGNTLSGVY